MLKGHIARRHLSHLKRPTAGAFLASAGVFGGDGVMRRKVWSGRDVVFGSVGDGITLSSGGEATDLFGGEANVGRVGGGESIGGQRAGGESLGGLFAGGESVSHRIDGSESVSIRHFGGESTSIELSGGESVDLRGDFGGESFGIGANLGGESVLRASI
jgi:hypothetical protein